MSAAPGEPRRSRLVRGAAAVALAAVAGLGAAFAPGALASSPPSRAVEVRIPVLDGPGHDQPLNIDATVYVPAAASPAHPVPAVIGAHGFGGDKDELKALSAGLVRRGYEVLLYSARGFGQTGGAVGLDGPDYDIADVRQLVDWLAARPEVLADGPGDPRVAVVGVSYGAGAALLAAGYDPRIDAVIPIVGWNSLVNAFDPGGVFKQQWASVFFGTPPGAPQVCPPFVPGVCAAYEATAAAGQLTPQARTILQASSPSSVMARIRAPTLLVQGQSDTLFPLNEAVSTATALGTTGVPVKMMWIAGGHSASASSLTGGAHVQTMIDRWLDRWLRREPAIDTGPAFEWAGSHGRWSGAPALPAAAAGRVFSLAADGRLAPAGAGAAGSVALANPAGGQPAALSDLPGASALAQIFTGLGVYDLPDQSASFDSPPLPHGIDVVGVPHLRFSVGSTTGEVMLFAKLYDIAPDGTTVLPGRAVAPLRLSAPAGTAATVDMDLAGVAHHFAAGHRVRLALAATDQGYANLRQPEHYSVITGPGTALALPLGHPVSTAGNGVSAARVAAALLLALVLAAMALDRARNGRRRRARRAPATVGPPAGTPLVLEGLGKRFKDDVVAVDDLNLRVEPGQVVGLLGPNGAGKTTTLRMAVGLVRPSAGRAAVFGQEMRPGHPVLDRVGTVIEGPGFVPHLSGLDNLRLWWRAGGRPVEEADFDTALAVAELGEAVHRSVRTYSHGMKQRLALAQALLGRPDLLVLDEPTNGLDPQQIREVRQLLAGMAAQGRTILLSSHLLAEVEQVCSHVAVMSNGRLIAYGPVSEIIGADRLVYVEVSNARQGRRVLKQLLGPDSVAADETQPGGRGLVVSLDGMSRSELVAALVDAGVGVQTVMVRRHLEDAFLGLLEEER